jgi:adenosylmethionine-8-amino-7-oxononanoate aminotransferase
MVIEPLLQGAAGMIPQPPGWLQRVTELVHADGAQWIADEVMTGFGRAVSLRQLASEPNGPGRPMQAGRMPLFASHSAGVRPDYLALAKGLTGGYLPMAATLTTQEVFDAFLGDYAEFKTFFHGHSYTGNQLGAAAGLASLSLLQTHHSIRARQRLERTFHEEQKNLWSLPNVGDVRQVGLVTGIELVRDWRTRQAFHPKERAGIRVCEAMARRGVLTRPIGQIVPLLPPFCTTPAQARSIVRVFAESLEEVARIAKW